MGFEVGINEKLDFTLRCSALGSRAGYKKTQEAHKEKVERLTEALKQR